MRLIQNLSIKYKLILAIMSTVVVSLLLVGSGVIIGGQQLSKKSMTEQLMAVSRILADRSTAALSFDDRKAATEILSALDQESTVVLACIYDRSQSLFATYTGDGPQNCPEKPQRDGHQFLSGHFELYQSVMLEGESIGTVYFRATLRELDERLVRSIILVMSIVLLACIVAYLMANKQQATISKPILELADIARQISTRADYSVRAPQGADNEMGTLNRAFNNMLEQIHKREVARDVAEQALKEKENNLAITLNSIGDAVIATDAEGCITRMNPVAEQLTGWSFEEAQGCALKTIFPIIHATTLESIENPIEKVIATGETVYLSNHTTLIARDGTKYQIADSAAPIRNEDAKVIGMVLVFNDITEQYRLRQAAAKSERDMKAVMDNTPAVIYAKDTEGKYIFINRQYEALFHIKHKDIIGRTDHDIFPADFADEFQRNDKAVLAAGHALESEEIAPHEGGPRSYIAIKFPLFNDDNKVYAVCGISTDITERKKQEEQLRRSQKMDALGKLTGGVAHDYNNLLGIISGYAEQLNEHLADEPKLAKYARDIQHAARRGAKLTKKLLAFSHHKAPDEEVLDINALLSEQQLMLEKTLTARIKLVFELADDLWPVCLDSGDLEDTIINMSINAMHAMHAVGELTIQTRNERLNELDAGQVNLDAGDYVLISITDTGSGMDEATKEKIFDPFYSTKGEQGTGLGLSQVYGFIERSGGAIKVYTEPGHGTRFSLYFPRSHHSVTAVHSPTESAVRNLQGSETLLVVDDEQAMAELVYDILTAQGYRVFTAGDGEQALAVLEKENIDLMISDVIMPNLDGYQLATHVQQLYPHIKIQMTSGFADNRHSSMEDDTLHQNILYKPYRSKKLLEHVRNLLDKDRVKVNLAGRTILVVDDEEDFQELFKLILERLGCKTVLSGNGDEAIALYRQSLDSSEPVDAVILDLNLPGGMGGREVAATILAMDPHARIIVASGHTEGPEMTRYQDYGFSGALEKNFDQKDLKQVLEQVLSTG
ncbi:MAG: hypothetical protein BMS9Abin08_0602 [Gammaproteobacteria bacterium]|nr:MAG: hypothetical protein BMS9Abin08_0602 [Gammaproteobacteria bacterium]